MVVFSHEIRRGFKSLCIWTGAVSFMLLICMLMFPEMKDQVDSLNDMFADMGSFTSAFGMDKINYGEAIGFYGVECGNMLGIGGGLFAALLGISALAKEEKDRTAEFLLTHPVNRTRIITEKLLAVIGQILIFNALIVSVSVLSFIAVGESIDVKSFTLLHLAYLALHVEIACICFGISAFIKKGSLGIGLGLALLLYFMNIIGNISDKAEFLKYITPYHYADAADIISKSAVDGKYLLIGAVYTAVGIVSAILYYSKKDIAA